MSRVLGLCTATFLVFTERGLQFPPGEHIVVCVAMLPVSSTEPGMQLLVGRHLASCTVQFLILSTQPAPSSLWVCLVHCCPFT